MRRTPCIEILVARLESPLETPEDRSDFAHEDLPRWVRSERPRLVAAALTILRAYTAHGAPSAGCKRWGSFEEWSRLIPHALVFAGGADPMLARPTGQRAMSDEMGALLTVFRDLPRLTRAPISAREMLSNLYPAPRQGEPPDGWDELREAVEVMCATKLGQTPTAKVLGERLRRAKGRVLDGRSLGSEMDAHSKVLKWTVSPAGTTPQN